MSGRKHGAVLLAGFTLAITTCADALAVPGQLDRTFGGDGKVATNFSYRGDLAYDVVLQPGGKIVAAGSSNGRFLLARYRPGGRLDPTFGGGDGKVRNRVLCCSYAHAVALQPDGKIVVAGTAFMVGPAVDRSGGVFALARYKADGTLDSSFGDDGTVTTDFPPNGSVSLGGMVIQTDGKIVAAGTVCWDVEQNELGLCDFALARYNTDGRLDSSFGGDGRVETNVSQFEGYDDFAAAVAVQSDGKIVAAGGTDDSSKFGLARYNTDGTLDSNFGTGGVVRTTFLGDDYAYALIIQSDGRLIAAGRAGMGFGRFGLARYNTDGTLDTAFGGDGRVMTDFTSRHDHALGVAVQATGKIVAVGVAHERAIRGYDSTFALARYNFDGTRDRTFSGDGKVTTNFTGDHDAALAVVIQPDAKIVAVGGAGETDNKFALARYRGG